MNGSIDFEGPDRRAKVRDPIKLRVRYRTLGRSPVAGVGESINLSSQGIFVLAPHQQKPSVGSRLEAIVEWPIMLNGNSLLELVTLGTVQRTANDGFAASFGKHKFRTLKRTGSND